MPSKATNIALNRRSPCEDAGSTGSNDIHRVRRQQTFGLASFTEDDLSALSRRRVLCTAASEPTTTQVCRPLARSMTPLEEYDDESVISVAPTGLRAQQEILSALQKENFRLKLSLHSHRRKETLQTARLESASTALQDIETRKNGLENTLKTLKSEIITGYRNLEKLVSEQLEGDGPLAEESCDRSNSNGSSEMEFKNSIAKDHMNKHQAHARISFGSTTPRALDIIDKQDVCPTQHSPEGIISKTKDAVRASGPTPKPTRRHIIESPNDIQPSNTDRFQTLNGNTIKVSHSVSQPRASSRAKPKTSTIELSNMNPEEKGDDLSDPWIIDIHLSNKRSTDNTSQQTVQQHDFIKNPATSKAQAKNKPTKPSSGTPKRILQKIFCELHLPLRTSAIKANRSNPHPAHHQAHCRSTDTADAGDSKNFKLFRTRTPETSTKRASNAKQGHHLNNIKKIISREQLLKNTISTINKPSKTANMK